MQNKERRKLNELLAIEANVQKLWDGKKAFEVDAPAKNAPKKEKFLVTFPFPYMNGRLHVGHTFSLSKAEFAVGFERMRGKHAIFPFGFHATGMPIKACADKLKAEIANFGNPPQFPSEDESAEAETKTMSAEEAVTSKIKSKKSKAVAKTGGLKYQWNIMKSIGLDDTQIPKFADENYWLDYFPAYCIQDLKALGVKADFRRSFMTTERNLYFDSFVRWQFRKLRSLGLIDFGKRFTVYSPKDGQACADHDRASGEGIGPQEYTLIKIRVLNHLPAALAKTNKPVFLVAATLRPETMYGQTNCYIHPDLNYAAFYVGANEEEIFVATKRAARNMAHQDLTRESGRVVYVEGAEELKGAVFVGAKLKAPLAKYEHVYALPMMSIKEDKGTGVVTSVPSDAPDDLVTLNELKEKPLWREKLGLTDEMVMPYEPVEIIDIPELGRLSAVKMVEALKIKSPKEKDKLEQAKKEVYLKGFYNGIMLVGAHAGKKTEQVKKLIQQELIDSNEAAKYFEPEKPVVSRSGDECVVALTDQWYLDYGKAEWKERAHTVIAQMDTWHEETRKNLDHIVDWLHEYACSRLFGLGTKLPWDERWVIESLSDSTIHTSYYSVAHLLQKGSLDGKHIDPEVKPEQLNDAFWEYVMIGKSAFDASAINVPQAFADRCKHEFDYWRAPNMRVSGKDLIGNHLTFYVFNHAAIFGDDQTKWPTGIRVNGHLMLNNEKMSKSTGNFLTLAEAVQQFGADGTRLALADAGDGLDDANFATETAESGLLRLFNFVEYAKELLQRRADGGYRSGERTVVDRYFLNRFTQLAAQTYEAYEQTEYKKALKYCLYEYQSARDSYRVMCGGEEQMHVDVILFYVETQCRLIAPLCPHVAEHVWQLLEKQTLIVSERWPVFDALDEETLKELDFITDSAHFFRVKLEEQKKLKAKKGIKDSKPLRATIYVARQYPSWQAEVVARLNEVVLSSGAFPDGRTAVDKLKTSNAMKSHAKKVMPFVQSMKEGYEQRGAAALDNRCEMEQRRVLAGVRDYLQHSLEVEAISVVDVADEAAAVAADIVERAAPFKPWIVFEFSA